MKLNQTQSLNGWESQEIFIMHCATKERKLHDWGGTTTKQWVKCILGYFKGRQKKPFKCFVQNFLVKDSWVCRQLQVLCNFFKKSIATLPLDLSIFTHITFQNLLFPSQATIFTLSTFTSSVTSLNSTSFSTNVQTLSQNLYVFREPFRSEQGKEEREKITSK